MFARLDEIPSLPVENIKEKPKRRGRTDRTDGQRENSIPPTNTFCRVYNQSYRTKTLYVDGMTE